MNVHIVDVHIVEANETPRDVAKRYTGNGTAVQDLVRANPDFPKVKAAGAVGNPVTFDPYFWRAGVQVKLPESWSGSGGVGAPQKRLAAPMRHQGKTMNGNPYIDKSFAPGGRLPGRQVMTAPAPVKRLNTGTVGQDESQGPEMPCDVTPDNDVKPYYFKVGAGEYPERIAKEWLGTSVWTTGFGPHTTQSLLRANYDKPGGFVTYGPHQQCSPKYWNQGDIVKIPASWPAPPAKWTDKIVNKDGTRYEPTGGEDEPDVPGTDGIDRVNWFGDDAGSTAVWAVLIIAAAGLGGALWMSAAKKRKGGAK